MSESRLELHIKALLGAAEAEGSYGLSATALTKYLYLVDYYASLRAVEYVRLANDWKFYHFGPYSTHIAQTISRMSQTNEVMVAELAAEDGVESRGRIYRLPEKYHSNDLRQLNLPKGVPLRIESALRAYRYDIPSLLNYVYFETEPMENAKPGEILAFPGPESMAKPEDVRVFKMQISKDRSKRIKELLAARAANFEKSVQVESSNNGAIYDDIFFEFLGKLDPVDTDVEAESARLSANASLRGLYTSE